MAKKKGKVSTDSVRRAEPEIKGVEAAPTIVDDVQEVVDTVAESGTTPERLQRGLAALHEAFKEYKRSNDAAMAEMKAIIEGVARKMRGGQ